MIAILGDIHFSSQKDYYLEICERFLDWFENWDMNHEGNQLILAGDLVQNALNGGQVIKFLEKIYLKSDFDWVHIVVGNHDLKKVDGINQLAYEFYKIKPGFTVYTEPTETTIEGRDVLMLPYFEDINSEGFTMAEYYSSIYKNPRFKNSYDLVVGHFAGDDVSYEGSTDCVKNLNQIKTKKLCLGHIHTRETDPRKYIGSVFANRKGENDNTRAAWIWNTVSNTWSEEKLPIFSEFLQVTYPDPLPQSDALVPIYTILNCASERLARELYGNIFIRKVRANLSDAVLKRMELADNFLSINSSNIGALFASFLKEKDPPLDEKVQEECKAALKIS